MLKIRTDVKLPPPKPLTPEAVDAFFDRLRAEMGLPPAVREPSPEAWGKWAKGGGARPVEF